MKAAKSSTSLTSSLKAGTQRHACRPAMRSPSTATAAKLLSPAGHERRVPFPPPEEGQQPLNSISEPMGFAGTAHSSSGQTKSSPCQQIGAHGSGSAEERPVRWSHSIHGFPAKVSCHVQSSQSSKTTSIDLTWTCTQELEPSRWQWPIDQFIGNQGREKNTDALTFAPLTDSKT